MEEIVIRLVILRTGMYFCYIRFRDTRRVDKCIDIDGASGKLNWSLLNLKNYTVATLPQETRGDIAIYRCTSTSFQHISGVEQ